MTKTAAPKLVSIRHEGQEIVVTYGRALSLSRRLWIVMDGSKSVWRVSRNAPVGWDEIKRKAAA